MIFIIQKLKNVATLSYSVRKYAIQFTHRVSFANAPILCELLGLPKSKVNRYIARYGLMNQKKELLAKCIQFCQELEYTNEEILRHHQLLKLHPCELENNYLNLLEGGFTNITPYFLSKHRSWYNRSVGHLKANNFLDQDVNIADCKLRHFDPEPSEMFCPAIFTKDHTFKQINTTLIRSYIKWRLNLSSDQILTLYRKAPMLLRIKSVRNLCEIIDIIEELGYTPEQVLKYFYMLTAYPKTVKTLLNDYSDLAGGNMREALKMYPRLFIVAVEQIPEIYKMLKDRGVTDEAIRNQMNIFTVTPATLKVRLAEIDPSIELLIKHRCILKAVLHSNRTKSRLAFLEKLKLEVPSLSIIKRDREEPFDIYVKEGTDNCIHKDIFFLIKTLLNIDLETIENQLKRHPFYSSISLKRIDETYSFLRKKRFSKNHISKVMIILLYPPEKIEEALKKVKESPIFTNRQKKLSSPQILNYIIYEIEKVHHFSGNGVWRNDDQKMSLEEPKEMLLEEAKELTLGDPLAEISIGEPLTEISIEKNIAINDSVKEISKEKPTKELK